MDPEPAGARRPRRRRSAFHRRGCFRLAALTLLLTGAAPGILAPPASGQPDVLRPRRDIAETMRDKVPVSGGVRRGLLAGRSDGMVDTERLSVRLPAVAGQILCVTIDARDGRYHAELEYELGTRPAGRYRLALDTKYASVLAAYRARELAVLAYLAPSCDETRVELIVPAAWGGGEEGEPGLLILVASLGADLRVYHGGERRYFACTPTAGVAYDTECGVTLRPGAGRVDLLLVRQHDETLLRPVALPVYAP